MLSASIASSTEREGRCKNWTRRMMAPSAKSAAGAARDRRISASLSLPPGAVKEGRARVHAALGGGGYALPLKRAAVTLAPADIRKDGSAFDLPIALGILAATEQIAA